jgi:hypothetical protein
MPHCHSGNSEALEVPYWIDRPAILVGRSGMETVVERGEITALISQGGAEWLDAIKVRVRYATGKIEKVAINRARIKNPVVPDALQMHDLSSKMSPPNPRGGNGNYNQSAQIPYYRLLDANAKGASEARKIVNRWQFWRAHSAFLAHVTRRLDQMRSKQKLQNLKSSQRNKNTTRRNTHENHEDAFAVGGA